MTGDLTPQSRPSPVRRTGGGISPVRRIMDLRSEALIERARISAEIANVGHEAKERTAEAYDLAEPAAQFTRKIQEEGNDSELHQMHTYIKGGAAAAIMDLMQGPPDAGQTS